MVDLAVRKDLFRIVEAFQKMNVMEMMDLLQAVQGLAQKINKSCLQKNASDPVIHSL
jgi:hypothetical protein